MSTNQNGQRAASNVPAKKQESTEVAFINYKNKITESVLNRIAALQKGGITVPKGFSADNQIYLAFLKLTGMTDPSSKKPVLSLVTPQSVANAMLTMCLKGLSMEKGQCTFIRYGNELQFQQEYHGTVALAKRYGAGDPQAQVIYEGDDFEYEINPKTGKKVVKKHIQKLQNINNDKIVGAWCLVPYADHPDWEPKVEVMTMDEIRRSWMQGATKGQSPAHRNFPQEMAKKTVIGRACKLFVSTSDDAGVYGTDDSPEWQESQEAPAEANAKEAVFAELPQAPEPAAVEAVQEDIPEPGPEDIPEEPVWEAPEDLKPAPQQAETPLDEGFFNL